MHLLRSTTLAALAAVVSLSPLSAVSAADAPKARFSDVQSYTGAPALPITLSLVVAGGGPKQFNSVKLLGVLAGDHTKAEVEKLTKQYGEANVKSFLEVFDFVINDSLKIAAEKKVALPEKPEPSPSDGKSLAAALYKAGVQPGGTFDIEYMFDRLVSHPIHVQAMDDIDVKFGRKADANYHIVLAQAMADLKSVYGL